MELMNRGEWRGRGERTNKMLWVVLAFRSGSFSAIDIQIDSTL